MLWGSAAISMALCVQALAQSTTLPQVTVEGKQQKKQTTSTKGAPKAAPTQPVEQVQPVQTPETTEIAKKEAVYNTPAAVSTATRSDIETFGQVDTGDVIRAMPGTSTQESPQNPGLAVNIRGFEGSGRVNMMIDGVRQNFRFVAHEAKGFLYVDPALLAGVDIMRGAVSTVSGGGALVGTANALTLGVDDIVKAGKSTGVLSTISYGTNGVGWSEMLAGGIKSGAFGVAGAISYHDAHDYKNGAGFTFPDSGSDLKSYLFKFDIRLSAESSLKLGAVMYDNDFIANSAQQNVSTSTYTAKYAYKPIGNPLIDFAFNAYANEVEMTYYNGPAGFAGRVINDQGVGFDASNTSRFKFGAVKVASTYGYEYFFDDVDAKNKVNPVLAGGANPAGEATIGGAFWQTQYSLGIFDLITGLRYDTYSMKGKFDSNGGLAGGTISNLDLSDERLSPKVTLAAQVTPWLQPYVTYSEAFRAPTLTETMFGGEHPTANGVIFTPNPFLKPEVQKGWELGANIKQDGVFTRGDHFRMKAAYYRMEVEDYIVGAIVGLAPGFMPITQFVNTPGKSRIQGLELEALYDAGNVFGGLSYTYTDSELPSMFSGTGAPGNLPYHIAVGTFGVRLLDRKLTIGTRVSYYSDWNVGSNNVGPRLNGGTYNTQFMPSYTLVDLFANYKVTENFELGIMAMNLFDVSYTPAGSTAFLPANPFTPLTPANCLGTNYAGCTDSGRGRTVLFTAKSHF